MAEDPRATMTDAFERNIFARPIDGESVLTVMGAAPTPTGPWSIVTGIPNRDSGLLGPLPQYLSVAAWAAWTVVTVVGVAYRGGIALEDIKVEFDLEPIELPGSIGFGVRELVTLKGNISESERVRLQRASQYCPVGQALTKGAVLAADQVRWGSGEVTTAPPMSESLYPLERELPAVTRGSVHGHYLLDTKEHDESGAMTHEGEVKVYVTCENLTRTSRWTILGGHSSEGWVPPPFPLAQSGWAASAVSTLRQLLPQETPGLDGLCVELATGARGNRGQSQANAADGVVNQRTVSRRITVPGTPNTTTIEMVQAALQRDPISMAYRKGGILLHEAVVVE